MNDTPNKSGVAPADTVRRDPWPRWKIVLAYTLLSSLSLAAIVLVDVKVHRGAVMPVSGDVRK